MNLGGFKEDSEGKVVANVFEFSLDDESQRGEDLQSLSDSLNLALELGYRIKIHYNQEMLTDWNSSRGSTYYYIDEVVILRD
jgi:hypothetical protein